MKQPMTLQETPQDLWHILRNRFSTSRQQRMLAAAAMRTNYVCTMLQDVHDPHNISACLRSAEAFGVQNHYIINRSKPFKTSTVARGVQHWLSLHHHTSIPEAIEQIKAKGYKIYAALPRPSSYSLWDLPVDAPICVAFGNEHAGVDPEIIHQADGCFMIPMVGMVESLNISVSCGITLASLHHRIGAEKGLSGAEQQTLLSHWVAKQVPSWQMEYDRLQNSESAESAAQKPNQ